MTDRLKPNPLLARSHQSETIPGLMPVLGVFSETEKPSRLERINGYSETREQLKKTKRLGSVLQQAEQIALVNFSTFAEEIPGLDSLDPKLRGVLELGNYQGVEQTSEEYGRLLQAKSLRQRIAREIVRDIIIDSESQVEISAEQRVLLKYGLQIQDTIDDLHIMWHKELVRGEHADELRTLMEDDNFLNLLIGEHGDFIYGMLRKEGSNISYVPYIEAYSQEIGHISNLIDTMRTELQPMADKGSDEAKAHIAVHTAWQNLLTFKGSAKEQEELGRELDVVWMRDADALNPAIRSQVLYPMEAYAAGKSVEWQYDILLKQPEYDAINDMCDNTKWEMHRLFQTDTDFRDHPTLQESLAILGPTDSTVYLRFISGTPLGFRSAASNVPNRNEVRLGHDKKDSENANGSKINFDPVTFEQRSQIGRGLMRHVFGEQKAEEIFGDTAELIPLLLGRFVAGHEDAHNILERPDTYKVMGMQNHIDLDEAKADLASALTCFQPNWLPLAEQATLIKAMFVEEMRGLSRWAESKTDRAHLNGNIILIQLMLDSGIVSFTDGMWNFDNTNAEKLQRFQHRAKDAFLDLATVYEAKEQDVARQSADEFKEKYTDIPSKELLHLVFDAGIFTENDYEEMLAIYHPPVRRTTTA